MWSGCLSTAAAICDLCVAAVCLRRRPTSPLPQPPLMTSTVPAKSLSRGRGWISAGWISALLLQMVTPSGPKKGAEYLSWAHSWHV